MSLEETNDHPGDDGKADDQPARKEEDMAALMRRLLAALEKQGNSSKGKH